MSTLVKRGLLVLGFSTLVGVAFIPLGDTGWAEGIRAEQGEQRTDAPASGGEPPLAIRVFAPIVKETLLIGFPAVLVILLVAGIRRFRR